MRISVKPSDESSVTVMHYGRARLQGIELTALYTYLSCRSYRLANLTQLDIPRLLEREYAKSRPRITRSLAGNAETSTWLRLWEMRLNTRRITSQI